MQQGEEEDPCGQKWKEIKLTFTAGLSIRPGHPLELRWVFCCKSPPTLP